MNIRELNLNALSNGLCPHCGSSCPINFDTCHACNKEFIWVSATKPLKRKTLGSTTLHGACLPGQEQEAIVHLDERTEILQAQDDAAHAGCLASLMILLTGIVGVGLLIAVAL